MSKSEGNGLNITKIEGSYPSSNQKNTIYYTIWKPDCNPRAVVQIAHGMCEYVDRYDEVARKLCEQGFVVCGNDHLGHGRSVDSNDELGYFAEQDGDLYLVRDLYALNQLMRKTYRSLPYVLLGHSFGSFIARAYMMGHGDSIDGLVLSGTSAGRQPVKFGMKVTSRVAKRKGGMYRSKLIDRLAFGSYNRRVKEPKGKKSGYEWITTEPTALSNYADDPHCTFIFTVQGFYDLFTLLQFVNSEEWYKKMPKGLPVFLIGGDEDPVGSYGKDIPFITEQLLDADASDVTYKIYPNERHEVLTGITRMQAIADVADFVDRVIDGVHAARMTADFSGILGNKETL